jgi:hypothetical protein
MLTNKADCVRGGSRWSSRRRGAFAPPASVPGAVPTIWNGATGCAEVGSTLGSLIRRVILRTMYAQLQIAYTDPQP